MKFFRPKSPPPAPEGVAYQFHFASDASKAPAAAAELAPAIERVATEVKALRATIDAAKGTRPAARLQAEIAQARVRIETAAAERDRMQAQARAGLITVAEYQTYYKRWNDEADQFRALTTELQQREQADAAAADLQRITEALQ